MMNCFRLIAVPALMLAMLASELVHASSTDELVLNLYRLERCGVMAASDYAKSSRADICESILAETGEGIEQVQSELDETQQATVLDAWNLIRDVYRDAIGDLSQFRNHYTINDIRAGRTTILEQLSGKLPEAPNPLATAILIERMAAEYIWRAESAWGAGATQQVEDIAVWVKEVDAQIPPLQKNYAESYDVRSAIKKYKFIRSSLINYNTNSIPYVVDRYASDIVNTLITASRSS